jgi:hypothetical protein
VFITIMEVRMDELKPWVCSSGHILGQVRQNGKGVTQLYLYREAVVGAGGDDEMAEVDVMAVVEGLVMDVRCSICGGFRTWVPGEEAIRRLLEKRGAKE